MSPKSISHIIVAGGSGSRFGSEIPKQFLPLNGMPVLMHSINTLRQATPSAQIVVALPAQYKDVWFTLCEQYNFQSPEIVEGGATRWHSVKNALKASQPQAEIITVHDGARPLVDIATINRVVAAISEGHVAAIPCIAVSDSLRCVESDGNSVSVDRSKYRAVQTPQAFVASALREAYQYPYDPTFTDDASVISAAGYSDLIIVEGNTSNIKITNPADIAIAEAILKLQH